MPGQIRFFQSNKNRHIYTETYDISFPDVSNCLSYRKSSLTKRFSSGMIEFQLQFVMTSVSDHL